MSTTQTPETFFADLNQRGHEPLLKREAGKLRWDVKTQSGSECWIVDINKGDVAVSKTNADEKADAVIKCDRDVLERLVSGDENAMVALLRGVLDAEGDLTLALSFQRLFPSPTESKIKTLKIKADA